MRRLVRNWRSPICRAPSAVTPTCRSPPPQRVKLHGGLVSLVLHTGLEPGRLGHPRP